MNSHSEKSNIWYALILNVAKFYFCILGTMHVMHLLPMIYLNHWFLGIFFGFGLVCLWIFLIGHLIRQASLLVGPRKK
jgi:hypothetical protein